MTIQSRDRRSVPRESPAAPATSLGAEDLLRSLIAAAPVGIVARDLDGRVLIWGATAERMFGWTAAEVVGAPYPLVPHDLQTEYRDLCQRVLLGEAVSDVETWRLRKDGSRIPVSLSTAPLRDSTTRPCGIISVLVDISQRRALEKQFLGAQRMEAVGQLAGGIAHDFNNLLTVMIGFASVAADRVDGQSEITADLEEITRAADRAAELTQQLLAFGRRQPRIPRVLDLNHLVSKCSKMLTRVIGEHIHLRIVEAPTVEHTRADPGQIEQVIMNLAVNARDAMPEGGTLTISTADVTLDSAFARRHPGAVPGRYVSLSVHDTGCGMPPEVLAKVFEPFFTTKDPGKGTGLGLSTVYGLVKQSEGYVTIDSSPGTGTHVTTYWPAVDEPLDAEGETPPPPTLGGTETILLVEDEASVRNVACHALEGYGYTVLSAGNAEEALTLEREHPEPIHLLVSDIVMPDMQGPQLAEHLVERRPGMGVLFVSGYADSLPDDRRVGGQHAGFLQKPFDPALLARTVREYLGALTQPAPGQAVRAQL